MEASDAQRLRDVQAEHAKLKRMYAELAMENHSLKELSQKVVHPAHKRPLWAWLMNCHGWSERRARMAMGLSRSTARYCRRPDRDEAVTPCLPSWLSGFRSVASTSCSS